MHIGLHAVLRRGDFQATMQHMYLHTRTYALHDLGSKLLIFDREDRISSLI